MSTTPSSPTPSTDSTEPNTSSEHPRPTAPSDRILSLDVLRGFALLGILVINIWAFGLPLIGWINPTLYGDFSGINYAAWFVSHVFFEQKFVTLFSMLFGAGIVLFMESKERKDQPARRLHFKRSFWLLAIGLLHAYLLWYGDILVAYAMCGFILVFVHRWSAKRLLIIGLIMFLLPVLFYVAAGVGYVVSDPGMQAEIEASILAGFGADQGAVDEEIAAYQGSWLEQIEYRAPTLFAMQTVGFLFESFWTLGGLMVIGMALYKWGLLTNDRSPQFYLKLLVTAGVIGFTLILVGVWYREAVAWDTAQVLLIGRSFNYIGSLFVSLAYLSGIMLLCQSAADGLIATALSAVGRTAFSNYLLQTLIATTIFYGHGLGLFATLTRAELLAIVVLLWSIQIPLSIAWLNRFQYGPVEWVWRTLTYGTRQPLQR